MAVSRYTISLSRSNDFSPETRGLKINRLQVEKWQVYLA